jgi:hypothetical protein
LEEDEESGELEQALNDAFPGEPWTPERVQAFKDAISACSAGGYPEEEAEGEKPASSLAMIFGAPKKKAK